MAYRKKHLNNCLEHNYKRNIFVEYKKENQNSYKFD